MTEHPDLERACELEKATAAESRRIDQESQHIPTAADMLVMDPRRAVLNQAEMADSKDPVFTMTAALPWVAQDKLSTNRRTSTMTRAIVAAILTLCAAPAFAQGNSPYNDSGSQAGGPRGGIAREMGVSGGTPSRHQRPAFSGR